MRMYGVTKRLSNVDKDEALSLGWVNLASWNDLEDMIGDEPKQVSNISLRLVNGLAHGRDRVPVHSLVPGYPREHRRGQPRLRGGDRTLAVERVVEDVCQGRGGDVSITVRDA
ncbi:hypothetical protein CNMCM7691_006686 [Aspergillus felis]|uniref:Uncharacterized protein n=1 Tax=Aspergillus felis TaxID=1287682 RepID=A0A8H6R6M6_9EURO|nr:hypothetical protein CNMCM7691_006686 [Aspergillus felis]